MDKILRALFVALAVGFGWGIRGHYGHLIGAMFPGAMLGLAFAYVNGQKTMFRWMPLFGTVGGLGIAIGGYTSYGLLHGFAQSGQPASWINPAYGFLMLAIQGGCWGTFGCAALAALLDQRKPSVMKFLELLCWIFFVGWTFQYIMVYLVGFEINPPRSNAVYGHVGGVLTLLIWLTVNRYYLAIRGALLGFCGFGMGMIIGRLIANVIRIQGWSINDWNVMEITVGLVGGFVFTLGMIGKKAEERPKEEGYASISMIGIFYVLGIIPLLHRLERIDTTAVLEQMRAKAAGWSLPELAQTPEQIAELSMKLVDLVILLGWVAAFCWFLIYLFNATRLSWFPVLALGGLLSFLDLFQQLYFFDPKMPGIDLANKTIDMRTVSMGIYALMILYVLIREFTFPHTPLVQTDEKMQKIPCIRWGLSCLLLYLCIVFAAYHWINGPVTMRSAATRWPLWSWKQGEFTGNAVDVSENVSPP